MRHRRNPASPLMKPMPKSPLLAALLVAAGLLLLQQRAAFWPSPLALRFESRLLPMAGCGVGCRI